jgi:tetratricopeptide (TPR) repeat protein
MKKKVLFLIHAFLLALVCYAQSTDGGVTRTEHFEVSGDDNASLAGQLEGRFEVYNRLFHFDPSAAALPLKVVSIADTDTYNQYVSSRAGSAAPGAVYLHYAQSGRRELVINRGSAGESRALPYQAFMQFFRAFVSQPPEWMREGFGAFFATLRQDDDTRQLAYEENLAWLDTVKNMKDRPPPEAILAGERAGKTTSAADFQALSWSLVSFLLNSGNEEYLRSLTDSFMTLSNSATSAQNTEAVQKRILLGGGAEALAKGYQNYLESRKTFNELTAQGELAYAAGDRTGAELAFRAACLLKPAHFVPFYYLGLIAYNAGNFTLAEQYYRVSLQNGADSGLVLYALGLNSAAAGRNAEAADYLRQAAEASPDRYKTKAEQIIARLK